MTTHLEHPSAGTDKGAALRSAWEIVRLARHPGRPVLQDYVRLAFGDTLMELHGDRAFGEDRALIGGFARIDGRPVMLIGHNKGKNVEENVARNFGMARPEGYRKALRLMKLAEKYELPVVTIVDTPGAYPGQDAEERGQAEAIAVNLREMTRLKVPLVCIVTGEGGSGGALGIAVGNAVLMLENSIYSVISPEGCASILWRDAAESPRAADALKLTASALSGFGLVDEVIEEPDGGAHTNVEQTADRVRAALVRHLDALAGLDGEQLVEQRIAKFSTMGAFEG